MGGSQDIINKILIFPGAKDPGWPLDTRPGSSPMSGLNYKSYLPRLLEKLQKKYY